MASLLVDLLNAPTDDEDSHLGCVLSHCAPQALLALSRCSWSLRQALALPLQQAEEESASKLCAFLGSAREELAAVQNITWRSGLAHSQCHHLGTWLLAGGPLQGATTLRIPQAEEEEDSNDEDGDGDSDEGEEIWLAELRSDTTEQLDFMEKGVSDELLMVLLIPMGALKNVTYLNLVGNKIGNQGMMKFSETLACGALASVTYLGLEENRIGDDGLTSLSSALATGAMALLQGLDLSFNKIGDAGMIKFSEVCAGGALPRLLYLHLHENQIGDAGLEALAKAAASGALASCRELHLARNQIGDAGLEALSGALATGSLPALETVFLSENPGDGAPVEKALADRNK